MTRVLITLAFAVCVVTTAQAEPERGRLEDGRAFRTDARGIQLVDYIAELELSVEELNRRILGLEDELEEKRQRLSQMESGRKEVKIEERDLLRSNFGDKPAVPSAAAELRGCPPARGAREFQNLAAELERLRRSCTQSEAASKAQAREPLDELRRELQLSRERLSAQDVEIKNLRERLDQAQLQVAADRAQPRIDLKAAPIAAEQPTQRSEEALVVVAEPQKAAAQTSAAKIERQPSAAQQQALAAVRGSVKSELNQLRSLVVSRNSQYQRYGSGKGRSLKFDLSRLESGRRLTIKGIAGKALSARTVKELSVLRKDIREIREKVQDDLRLINRMKRLG